MGTDWDAVIGLQFSKFSPFNSFPSLKVSIFVKSRCRSPDTGLFVVCPPRTNAATNKRAASYHRTAFYYLNGFRRPGS